MEDNKLIADFMGYRTSDTQFKDENGFWNETSVFETSWDWLMPVVNECKITDNIDEALLTCNIDRVYKAVVQFIKTHNDGRINV